ncbi:MAG: DNA translocase FtsK [Oscillospiraceae bacterium]|nr:DNA translocase FtsK [Oscillospiraceae bacterium]
MATKKRTGRKPEKRKTNTKTTTPSKEESIVKSPLFIHGVIWAMLSLFSSLFMYIDTKSALAETMQGLFGGLFGIMAYMMPLVFFGTLFYLIYFKSIKQLWIKFSLCILELIDIGTIIGLFAKYEPGKAFEYCSRNVNGGGVLGVFCASKLSGLIGSVGAMFLLVVLFIVIACIITRFNILPYLIFGVKRICGISTEAAVKVKTKYDERETQLRERMEEEDKRYSEKVERLKASGGKKLEHKRDDSDEELPKSLSERIGKKGRFPKKTTATIDIANGFSKEMTDGDDKIPTVFDDPVTEEELFNMQFPDPEAEKHHDDTLDEGEEEFDIKEAAHVSAGKPDKQREENLTAEEKQVYNNELSAAAAEVQSVPYEFPPISLLDKPRETSSDKRHELYEKAQQLISVLDNFGVKAKPVQVTQGPTVTRFEIQPQSGIKLSKIVGLADDIALNLAVSTVLIAPVPGKAATVGVEIPNTNVTPVTIREILESPEFKNAKSKLTVGLGKDIGGNVVVGDIAKWPHALIAGATGSGKSVCINTIITSILYKADPNEVKLIMIDPKQVELGVYNGIPHLLIPVVTEAKKAAGALNWAVSEMMQRYEKFKDAGVRKLDVYNKLMEKSGGEKLPQIVIIIDELADLMMVAAKEVEDYICRLAQLARAAGIHLIIATQRPSVDVITGLIKANVPSRIAFFVSSQVDSRTILDKAGAEKLLGRGDMLYFPAGARSTTRVQGAMVTDDDDGEVARIVNFIKDTSPETHYREDLADHIERIQLGENGVTPDKEDDGDALLNDAIKLAVELGKISTSMVQRRLSVGYSRAGRIIDQMEARGIISPANGAKPRDVLISYADLESMQIAADYIPDGYDEAE